MSFLKTSIIIIIAVISAVLFFQWNIKNKVITPIVKRTTLEDMVILQFPKRNDETYMEALVQGKLLVQDKCLKLNVLGSDETYTLVFPSLFHIQIENETLVIKHDNKVLGQEGMNIEISGGETLDIAHLGLTGYQQCDHPPFWIVGAEMRSLN